MDRKLLAAGVALSILIPSAALAQETCEQRSQNRTAGTAIGAVAGALLGGSIAGHHNKTEGAVLGGVAGAVVGNQIAKGPKDCQHAYGWYDNGGRWHANAVEPSAAWGYYDQRGEWVEGRPADYRPTDYQPNDYRPDYRPDPYRPAAQDWDDRERYDGGYPEFRRMEDRIREEIRQGVREDVIEPEDARDLMGELREIRMDEMREFQAHGRRLPYDDRARLRDRLMRLDREVDQVRREP